jgi:hypothetical protein
LQCNATLAIAEIGGSKARGRTTREGDHPGCTSRRFFRGGSLGKPGRRRSFTLARRGGQRPLGIGVFELGVFPRKGSLPDGRDYRLGVVRIPSRLSGSSKRAAHAAAPLGSAAVFSVLCKCVRRRTRTSVTDFFAPSLATYSRVWISPTI